MSYQLPVPTEGFSLVMALVSADGRVTFVDGGLSESEWNTSTPEQLARRYFEPGILVIRQLRSKDPLTLPHAD